MVADPPALTPRKQPIQRRATATVDALHQAAIQVLTDQGLERCTTTRIAERAGVSVGSLYQYYPNRDALLAAVLGAHLDRLAAALEEACVTHRNQTVAAMASGLVEAFIKAKFHDPLEARALYSVAEERDGAALVGRAGARMTSAVTAMLATARDATFSDPPIVAAMVLSAIVGPVRTLLEDRAPSGFGEHIKRKLTCLVSAYLEAEGRRSHVRS